LIQWLLFRGRWRERRTGSGRVRLRGAFGGSGLETFELVEGAVVGAVGGVDAALEAGEVAHVTREQAAEGPLGVEPVQANAFGHLVLPQLGFDFAEAAEHPFAGDQRIDQEALLGGGGRKRSWYSAVRASRASASSPGMTLDLASMPVFRALKREAALPSTEGPEGTPPEDFCALRRLASI
jgi:hypothetical protein